MHRFSRKMVLVLVVVGALVAGGAAYTDSITGTDVSNGTTAGYAGVSISGATLDGLTYGFDSTGANITTVNLTFGTTPNVQGDDVQVSFDSGTLASCGTVSVSNTATCTVSEATASATSLNIAVSNPS